jgi:transposase-like protein
MSPISYARHQFPPVVIRQAVWLYLRFTLSYRDVEELLAERGLEVSYETVRRWVLKFGPVIAHNLRRLRPRPSPRWHLDEMVVKIAGERMYLWRAVDDEGEVLDLLVQRRRDKEAAKKLMRKLLKRQGFAPTRITTDKLGFYGPAFRNLGLSAHHERGLPEQPGRGLPPAGPATLVEDAAVQIARLRPALRLRARRRPQYLRPPAPSRLPPYPSQLPGRGDGAMAGGDRGGVRTAAFQSAWRTGSVLVTEPSRQAVAQHGQPPPPLAPGERVVCQKRLMRLRSQELAAEAGIPVGEPREFMAGHQATG